MQPADIASLRSNLCNAILVLAPVVTQVPEAMFEIRGYWQLLGLPGATGATWDFVTFLRLLDPVQTRA